MRFTAGSVLLAVLPVAWAVMHVIVAAILWRYGISSPTLAIVWTALSLLALTGVLWLTEGPATRCIGESNGLLLRRTSDDWPTDIFGQPRIPTGALAETLICVAYLFARLRKALAVRRVRASRQEILAAAKLLPFLDDPDGMVRAMTGAGKASGNGLDLLRSLGLARP